MNKYQYIIKFVLMFFLIGCGSNATVGNNPTQDLHSVDTKKLKKAIISEKNILKFAQAIHYIEKLDINLNTSSYQAEGKTIKNHIDKDSGLGYIEFNYKDFKELGSDNIVNGTSRIDILNINKTTGIEKIKGEFDLTLATLDNNISLYVLMSSDFNMLKDEFSPMTIYKYKLYDQKNNEHIELLDTKEIYIDDKDKLIGKLYIEGVGYVNFENIDFKYKLFGEENSEIVFTYKHKGSIDVLFNHKQISDLYYVKYHVTRYEPPKFKTLADYKEIDYSFGELSIHYEFENLNTKDIQVQIDWFVNNKKVKTPIPYELPRENYKENDQIKVVLTAIHGDMSVTKEINFKSKYTQFSSKYTADVLDIEYYTNNLEFQLNILDNPYFDNIDINNTIFSWKFEKGYYGNLVPVNAKYTSIPMVKADHFSDYTLYLKMYNNHQVKILKINLKIKLDYFRYKSYKHFDSDIEMAYDPHLVDMNNDGRKDIVYSYSQPSDYYRKLMVRFQDKNSNFDKYEIYDLIKFNESKRIIRNDIIDLNNDRLKDIVLYVSDGNMYIFLQNQNKEFKLSKVFSPDEGLTIGDIEFKDLNEDGLKDMIVETYDKEHITNKRHLQFLYQHQNESWKKEFDFQFEGRIYYKIEDLNQDGLKDMIFSSPFYYSHIRSLIKVFYQDENKHWDKTQELVSDANKDNTYSFYLYNSMKNGINKVFINRDIYSYNGSLLEKTGTLPLTFNPSWFSAQVGKFNSDSLNDIVLKNGKNKWFLLLTDGANNFSLKEYESTEEVSAIFVNDLNYDGLDDLVINTNLSGTNNNLSVYLNKGNKLYTSLKHSSFIINNILIDKKNILFGDFNGDGVKDINIDNENIVLLNINDLAKKPLYFPYGINLNTQIYDFNGDGRDDIMKLSSYGKITVALSKR